MKMRPDKKKKLEDAGWTVSDASEFLGLSFEEATYIDLKLSLAHSLRAKRKSRRLTQAQFARLVNSSQSRVAKMESADPGVSLDLIVRSMLALGAGRDELARAVSKAQQG